MTLVDMIRLFQLIVTIVVMLCALTVAAQEKMLTESEFNSVWKKACETTSHVPHTFTETNEEYFSESKPPYSTYTSVKRYVPPDRVWTVAGHQGGKPEDKYEEIRIGRKSYSRDGTGPWKFQELGFSGLYYCEPETSVNFGAGNGNRAVSDGSRSSMKFENEYKYIGRSDAGAISTDLYVHVKRMKVTNAGSESETTFTKSYWINRDGLFQREEFTTRTAGSPRLSRQLGDYNYDQKDLKIEAPIK